MFLEENEGRRYSFVGNELEAGYLVSRVVNFHLAIKFSTRDLNEADGYVSQKEVEATDRGLGVNIL
jgi:hypothetical protein